MKENIKKQCTYQKIPKSDTNYITALYEMIYSNFTDSNYAISLPLIEEGMKYFPEKIFRWFNHKANVLDNMGKSNDA